MTNRLPDGSGFMVAELTDPEDHPLRRQATDCAECGAEASVFFNAYNVDVTCHHQGCRERDPDKRQLHLSIWVDAAVLGT